MQDKSWKYRAKQAVKKEIVKEFEGWSENDFINHILELREMIEELEKTGGHTGQKTTASKKEPLSEKNFKQEWSYPTKIAFLLTLHQRPLTSDELHHLLLKLDKHYKDYDFPKTNLAASLSRAVKSKRISKIKMPGIKSLYFVLPEWVDKEGKLKGEFGAIDEFR